ncbi:MAG: hypothetical protein ACLUD2_15400 [Clostridium sp.]
MPEAVARSLKVARTLADLEGKGSIERFLRICGRRPGYRDLQVSGIGKGNGWRSGMNKLWKRGIGIGSCSTGAGAAHAVSAWVRFQQLGAVSILVPGEYFGGLFKPI